MKMKNIILSCAALALLTGCTGIIVKKAEKPYRVEEVRAEKPYEVKEELIPQKIELISDFAPGTYPKLKLGSAPVSPLKKNTVAKLEEEAKRTGRVIFVNTIPLVLETMSRSKKWYRGIVDPGHIFLAEKSLDPKTGVEEYTLSKLGICNNPVRGVKVKISPAMKIVREKYRDTVVERYRDVDYTPAIWAGLAGVAVGYLIHPAVGTRYVSAGSCASGSCGAGVPAPRPGP